MDDTDATTTLADAARDLHARLMALTRTQRILRFALILTAAFATGLTLGATCWKGAL